MGFNSGFKGLNPAEGMEVQHLCLLRLVQIATTGHSFKGVLSRARARSSMCVYLIVCDLENITKMRSNSSFCTTKSVP